MYIYIYIIKQTIKVGRWLSFSKQCNLIDPLVFPAFHPPELSTGILWVLHGTYQSSSTVVISLTSNKLCQNGKMPPGWWMIIPNIYIYIYVYIYMYMYIYIYVYVYIYMESHKNHVPNHQPATHCQQKKSETLDMV